MNCPGRDRCYIREHKGYNACTAAGECLDLPPVSIRDYRRRSDAYRAELERLGRGRRPGNLVFLVMLLALAWAVVALALLGFLTPDNLGWRP